MITRTILFCTAIALSTYSVTHAFKVNVILAKAEPPSQMLVYGETHKYIPLLALLSDEVHKRMTADFDMCEGTLETNTDDDFVLIDKDIEVDLRPLGYQQFLMCLEGLENLQQKQPLTPAQYYILFCTTQEHKLTSLQESLLTHLSTQLITPSYLHYFEHGDEYLLALLKRLENNEECASLHTALRTNHSTTLSFFISDFVEPSEQLIKHARLNSTGNHAIIKPVIKGSALIYAYNSEQSSWNICQTIEPENLTIEHLYFISEEYLWVLARPSDGNEFNNNKLMIVYQIKNGTYQETMRIPVDTQHVPTEISNVVMSSDGSTLALQGTKTNKPMTVLCQKREAHWYINALDNYPTLCATHNEIIAAFILDKRVQLQTLDLFGSSSIVQLPLMPQSAVYACTFANNGSLLAIACKDNFFIYQHETLHEFPIWQEIANVPFPTPLSCASHMTMNDEGTYITLWSSPTDTPPYQVVTFQKQHDTWTSLIKIEETWQHSTQPTPHFFAYVPKNHSCAMVLSNGLPQAECSVNHSSTAIPSRTTDQLHYALTAEEPIAFATCNQQTKTIGHHRLHRLTHTENKPANLSQMLLVLLAAQKQLTNQRVFLTDAPGHEQRAEKTSSAHLKEAFLTLSPRSKRWVQETYQPMMPTPTRSTPSRPALLSSSGSSTSSFS